MQKHWCTYQCLIVETPVSLLWLWDFISFHEMKFFISCKERKSCNFNEYQFGKVWSISLWKKNTPGHKWLLPPHLCPQHYPCAGHLSKKQLLLFHLGLGLKKPQSPELQGCCSYKRHAKGKGTAPTLLPSHLSAWHHPCVWHLSKRLQYS